MGDWDLSSSHSKAQLVDATDCLLLDNTYLDVVVDAECWSVAESRRSESASGAVTRAAPDMAKLYPSQKSQFDNGHVP
jgi:hypothetical protein